jgi:hypothetical protein
MKVIFPIVHDVFQVLFFPRLKFSNDRIVVETDGIVAGFILEPFPGPRAILAFNN